jgi:hypothetical protein
MTKEKGKIVSKTLRVLLIVVVVEHDDDDDDDDDNDDYILGFRNLQVY